MFDIHLVRDSLSSLSPLTNLLPPNVYIIVEMSQIGFLLTWNIVKYYKSLNFTSSHLLFLANLRGERSLKAGCIFF